jgi:hypothetical protein
MGFASSWLKSGTLFPEFIREDPEPGTGIIVVVPAFDEPSITELLDSLLLCTIPSCKTEVIIIINAPQSASPESLRNNFKTLNEIDGWKKAHSECFFRLFTIHLGQPAIKGWGVGLARKTVMDEALKRFDLLDRPDGLIVNLDADCTVQENYFETLEQELLNRKERKGCSIYFEHPVSGDKFPENVYNSVYQYELHLRYYFQALAYTGFPNVFHTVGSSIAVKSLSYIKAGGMNRRQAGEDFYFVQKLLPGGGYFSLNSTTVYPSPRASERVPFGTGAAVGKLVADNSKRLLTYNPLAFKDLFVFFEMVNQMFNTRSDELISMYCGFPESLKPFLDEQQWIEKISEIKNNTSGLLSFRKRFFEWFNMFRVVKYLNFCHKTTFEKIPVNIAADELLSYNNVQNSVGKSSDLLEYYRALEKNH